jgi:Na+-translocating ferredoxin:NAD+ oxidoreductase RnfE subunit
MVYEALLLVLLHIRALRGILTGGTIFTLAPMMLSLVDWSKLTRTEIFRKSTSRLMFLRVYS